MRTVSTVKADTVLIGVRAGLHQQPGTGTIARSQDYRRGDRDDDSASGRPDRDWRENPKPQWIFPLSGRWFVDSMEGQRVEMGPGVLWFGADPKMRESGRRKRPSFWRGR